MPHFSLCKKQNGFGFSYHFSTDTILLAHFSLPSGKKRCADLGTGCGTIPLLWLRENPNLDIAAVEIQNEACELACRTVEFNGLEQNLTIFNADLKELKGKLPFGAFDVVACNPPYKRGGSGIQNPANALTVARHETECTLDDICGLTPIQTSDMNFLMNGLPKSIEPDSQ